MLAAAHKVSALHHVSCTFYIITAAVKLLSMAFKVKNQQTDRQTNKGDGGDGNIKQHPPGRECLRRPRHRLMSFAVASRDQTLQLSNGKCCI